MKLKFISHSLMLFVTLISATFLNAQKQETVSVTTVGEGGINGDQLQTYYIKNDRTIQFVSPEPIKYVDISTNNAEGDLPTTNIARLKAADSLKEGDKVVVSIVTDHFIATYNLIVINQEYTNITSEHHVSNYYPTYVINIDPQKADQLDTYGLIGEQEFKKLALNALTRKREIYNISTLKYGMEAYINNIYTAGDYIIVDLTGKNKTKIQYNVSDVVFRLEDKKLTKATVSQEIQLMPLYSLYGDAGTIIKGRWRNIYLFKKFTYPEEKILTIEFGEEEISGRKIQLTVDYNQLLHSEYLN